MNLNPMPFAYFFRSITHLVFTLSFFGFFLMDASAAQAQSTVLSGTVAEATTGQPLAFVTVAVEGNTSGTLTDSAGRFRLHTDVRKGALVISFVGYQTVRKNFSGSKHFSINLKEDRQMLEEVRVAPKKEKYRNKNNPAVALIRRVIQHKSKNRIADHDFISYQEYEKLNLSLVNPGPAVTDNLLSRKYRFLFENIDTVSLPGDSLLPVYLEENLYRQFYRKHPEAKKTIHDAKKRINFDERFINNESLTTLLKYLYQELDLYQNEIYILTNSFLSPIADMAPTFYKFYIVDTVVHDGEQLVRMDFSPRNNNDLLFYGTLFVTLDGSYAVRSGTLSLSKHANVNWVNKLKIELKYQKGNDGRYIPEMAELSVLFGIEISPKGLWGQRLVHYSNYGFAPLPDTTFSGPAVVYDTAAAGRPADYWHQHRPASLSTVERTTYRNLDSLAHMKSFNRILSWASFLFAGYKNLGPFEIGPWGTFYSFNPVEGLKLRIAGRTTPAFSKRFYLAANTSYGFKDKRWKYYLSGAYAFNKSSIYDYPQHYIQIETMLDTRIPGQVISFAEEENILLSIKRGVNDKYLYNDIQRINYIYEPPINLRLKLSLSREKQEAAGGLVFVDQQHAKLDTIPFVRSTHLCLDIRYAPHERFFDKKNNRKSIPGRYPITTLSFVLGLDDFLDGDYDYHKIQLHMEKRFYLSQLGHADVTWESGYLLGRVPYPLLFIPRANQTYNYQLTSFNLMNFLEFTADHYTELSIDYHMHGFLLNKIPILRALKLREVATFKGIYGGLRRENDPAVQGMFRFPETADGQPATYSLSDRPYMEFSLGIENIFRVFRVDYVRRINYLNHPNVSNWGIRVRTHLAF